MTTWPAADTDVGLAVFWIVIEATGSERTEGVEVTEGPAVGVPVTVAESMTDPCATSAAVTV